MAKLIQKKSHMNTGGMRNVASKFSTHRTAKAETSVQASKKTIERIRSGTIPKGNVFELTRAAVLGGVKRCAELVPFCHQVSLDVVTVEFELHDDHITIRTHVEAVDRTGVEIEALLAAQLAALNLYDLLKPIDENLDIGPTHLIEKTGGYHDYEDSFSPKLKAAILVCSDSTFAGNRQDKSGLILRERLSREDIDVVTYDILPDETAKIERWLKAKCSGKVDLILTTGGSGLGPRDCAVEATRRVIEKEIPGISEAMRGFGRERTPYAMLSRGLAGLRDKTLIVNFPGSSRGAQESLDALLPGLLHSFKMMRGGGH